MKGKRQGSSGLPRTAAEWVALSLSLLLLAGVVGVIAWLWAREPKGPPQFRVERGAVRQDEAGLFHLPVALTNVGGAAAAQVRVEGRLAGAGGQGEERPTTTIEFLPVQGRAEAVLIFRSDPSSGASVEVVSYQHP